MSEHPETPSTPSTSKQGEDSHVGGISVSDHRPIPEDTVDEIKIKLAETSLENTDDLDFWNGMLNDLIELKSQISTSKSESRLSAEISHRIESLTSSMEKQIVNELSRLSCAEVKKLDSSYSDYCIQRFQDFMDLEYHLLILKKEWREPAECLSKIENLITSMEAQVVAEVILDWDKKGPWELLLLHVKEHTGSQEASVNADLKFVKSLLIKAGITPTVVLSISRVENIPGQEVLTRPIKMSFHSKRAANKAFYFLSKTLKEPYHLRKMYPTVPKRVNEAGDKATKKTI